MFANCSHVKYKFANTKELVKKLARIETSSFCRQQFPNVFDDCFCAVQPHQLEFANFSLPFIPLYLPTQKRFPIGGERVTCHGSKVTNFLELSTLMWQVVYLKTVANLCASRPDVKRPLKSANISH